MRKLITIIFTCCFFFQSYGQQDVQYTQFMLNKIAFNPAYAGNHNAPCFTGIYRTQWVSLEGAPISQNFSFHTPLFKNRVGLGLNLHHDKIGPTRSWYYSMMYAYRIKMNSGHLSFGMQGLIRDYRVDWSGVTAIHSGDALYGMEVESKLIPNFGIGTYFQNNSFYVGLSIPRLLNGDLTFGYDGNIQNTDYSREERHIFLMTGLILPLSSAIKFKPAALLKYTANAPFDVDLHAGLIFYDRLNLGVTYRAGGIRQSVGESIDFVLQAIFTPQIKLGLAYDYTLSKIRDFQSGSYEIMLEYCLVSKQKGTTNPRFF